MAVPALGAGLLTPPPPRPQQDPWWVRWTLTTLALGVIVVLVIVPVAHVFYNALAVGAIIADVQAATGSKWTAFATSLGESLEKYWNNLFANGDTLHSILLTLTVAPVAVLANTVFGLAAAWAIARFRFPGRTLLTTLIDIPFSISPVVAGLIFVLIFGLQGYLGPWLRADDIKIIFAYPGLVLATAFITFPFVARELIPVMEAIGAEEETAAVSLGASPWQMFWLVTLPNIKWGLLYGIILCNARAMGEFGAVYVVSGHIAGQTDTIPLRVEKLFQEYQLPASFALASLLTLLALVTLIVKAGLEGKVAAEVARAGNTAKSKGGA
ncbi:sulfate/thiosulfate transporter permease subunit [Planctomycetaceae bacterium SCGC AG-212-F19]|nr:sulfate/thiosulfate transporter permease subunit [Planctomycetaceae bacterium SCGC AG-212-F19]